MLLDSGYIIKTMKLEEIKDKIDKYFDNVSPDELYETLKKENAIKHKKDIWDYVALVIVILPPLSLIVSFTLLFYDMAHISLIILGSTLTLGFIYLFVAVFKIRNREDMEEEDFVELEQATELKKLGFNEKCICFYIDGVLKQFSYPRDYNDISRWGDKPASAPLIYQAQRWLRKKGLILSVYHKNKFTTKYFYGIDVIKDTTKSDTSNIDYSTYEECLSKGIDKAIEILKENDV